MSARSLKNRSKSGESLEPKPNPILAPSSRGSSDFVNLADRRPHRVSESLEPVVKLAAEGLTLIRQFPSTPAPSGPTYRWKRSSPPLPGRKPHSLLKVHSPPFINPPPPQCHRCFAWIVRGKRGFTFLGLILVGPLWFLSWPLYNNGGPTSKSKPSWPKSELKCDLNKLFVSLLQRRTSFGQGLLSSSALTKVQRLFNTLFHYNRMAKFDLLLVSNSSCEKRLQISSQWERS